ESRGGCAPPRLSYYLAVVRTTSPSCVLPRLPGPAAGAELQLLAEPLGGLGALVGAHRQVDDAQPGEAARLAQQGVVGALRGPGVVGAREDLRVLLDGAQLAGQLAQPHLHGEGDERVGDRPAPPSGPARHRVPVPD